MDIKAKPYTFKQMETALEPFMTDDMLKMEHHDCNTQLNEGLNTSAEKYPRKGRTYSENNSCGRISIIFGLHNFGRI